MSRRPVRRWAIQEIAIIGPKSCMKWEEKLHYKRFQKRKPNRKNRVDPHIEQQAEAIAIDYRAYGQKRASNKLAKRGTNVSAGGVRFIWLRVMI